MSPRTRFFVVYTIIFLVQIISFFLWPIGWLLRFLGKWNPLWFTQDDGRLDPSRPDGLAVDYAIHLNDFKWRWLGVIDWHMRRNPGWNFLELWPVYDGMPEVGNQKIEITNLIIGELEFGTGRKVAQDGPYVIAAGLKYVADPGEDPWQVNKGDEISANHSIVGTGHIEYRALKPNGDYWYSIRYSQCKIVEYNFLFFKRKYWRTLSYGTNAKRYTVKIKHQAIKPWVIQMSKRKV